MDPSGVVGEVHGESPIGGGLLGVGVGTTPVPAVAAVVFTVAGGVTGELAFGGVTGRTDPFSRDGLS